MGDNNKTEVVLFDDMSNMSCPVCRHELQWSMVLEEPASKLAYVANCCGIQYHAFIHMMMMTRQKDEDDPHGIMCRCGHEEGEHSRDRGCNHMIGYTLVNHHGTGDIKKSEKCSCWTYRRWVRRKM